MGPLLSLLQSRYAPGRLSFLTRTHTLTLAELSIKLMCPESSEDDSKVTLMVLAILGIDEDVFDEDYDKLIQLFHKYLIHEVHEKGGCVC
jgi:hypothetical protein